MPIPDLIREWCQADKNLTDKAAVRALCRFDRYYLLVRVLRRTDCLHNWIYRQCRMVEANPDGFIDIWAREHYKSTVITFAGLIQEILRDPEITIGIFSHTKKLATDFVDQIKREFEDNAVLRWAFDDILWARPESQAPKWSADQGLILKRLGNPKEATLSGWGLVDGMPTGMHYALMLYDDVVTDKSVGTVDQITKTTEAWSLSSNLSKEGGRKWYVGTRYHFADTYQTIIDRCAAAPRIHPATLNGQKDGVPVLFSRDEWEKRKRDSLDSTLACQMLCSPLAGSQRMFNVAQLKSYEARPLTLQLYLLCDPARSKKKNSAHTAMVVIGLDSRGNKYLLDGVDHKMDLMERWKWFRDLYYAWHEAPGVVGIVAGYESFGAQADLDYFKERQSIEKLFFEVVELSWPRDGEDAKTDRIQRLVPDVRGGRFYMPYPTEPDRITKLQRSMIAAGYDYRVSRKILRLDENRVIYDVTERLRLQFDFFPFGGRVDLLDATSRLYDAAPAPPEPKDQQQLEPDVV